MSRAILWFWYLILIWVASFCAFNRLVLAVTDVSDSKTTLRSKITNFIIGSEELNKIPTSTDAITVIASRLPSFKTPLNNIPANVSYKSREDLDRTQPHFFQDSVRDLEGVVLYDNVGNGLDRNFSLRGFSDPSAVIFLVDGVRVNEVDGDVMTYPLLPAVQDIESIQVERGSQSPVYGSGAFGGIVNIVTRKPSPKLANFFGQTEWSSFGGAKIYQGVSGTIPDKVTPIEGNLTYFFNMGRDMNQGFRNNGEWRITSLDTKLGYELPDESGGVQVGVKHVHDAVSNPGELSLDQFHADSHATNKPLDGRDFRNTIIQMEAHKKFWNDKILASALAYWRIHLVHFYSTFSTFASPFPTQLTTNKSRQTDLILQTAYQDEWGWLKNKSEIGFELRNASQFAFRQNVLNSGHVAEGTAPGTNRDARPESGGLFWRETLTFFDRVIAYVGMRHDRSYMRINDAINRRNNYSRRWTESTASTGILVKPMEWTDLFFNFSEGFRVPSISEVNSFNSDLNATLEPEQADSYEIGTRLRYKDLAQAKSSWFLIDVVDEIVSDAAQPTAANPFGRNINAGKTRRYGIENRVDIQPIPEFSGYGSYTWVKAFISEAPPGGIPFNDREIGQIPQNTLTMGGTLKPFKRLGSPYEGFEIGIDGIFIGKQRTEAHESTQQLALGPFGFQGSIDGGGAFVKPYSIWNLTALYRWKTWNLYFKVNNLFDEHYFSRARAVGSSGGIFPAGSFLVVNPGAPREYLLGMTWEFGN